MSKPIIKSEDYVALYCELATIMFDKHIGDVYNESPYDIDEMVIDDAYDTDQVEFYHEGEEFILENPRFYDTFTIMKGL